MEESTTYQAILRRGELRGELRALRWAILCLRCHKFGGPRKDRAKDVEAITDRDRLWGVVLRIHDASTWEELLA